MCALVSVGLALSACGGDRPESAPPPASDPAAQPPPVSDMVEPAVPEMIFEDGDLPIVFQPGESVKELYGYDPEYPPNVPTFDRHNRPYLRSRGSGVHETGSIWTLRDGGWVERDFTAAIKEKYPEFSRFEHGGGLRDTRVIFDREDRAYTVVEISLRGGGFQNLLLGTKDYGKTFTIAELPRFAVQAEHWTGHNPLAGPPFIMISRRLADHPGRWARRNELSVTRPRWEGDRLVVPEPVVVSDRLISLGQHSGGPSFAVSRDGVTHFVWAEVTDDEDAPGTPSWIGKFDDASNELVEKKFLTYAPPINNSHNVPGIVRDSRGYFHVVTGSHFGDSFLYLRSPEPDTMKGEWHGPEAVWDRGWIAVSGEERGGQTYVSLVCGPDDTLHLIFRHWQSGMERYPHLAGTGRDQIAALSYQRKPPGESWTAPRTLVVPERNIYSIWYQKLSIDHRGRLFASLSYHDRVRGEEAPDERFWNRTVLISGDGGDTWDFAGTDDFLRGMEPGNSGTD